MSTKLPSIGSQKLPGNAKGKGPAGKLGWLRRVEAGAGQEVLEAACLPALDVPQRAQTPWEYSTPQRVTDLELPPDVSKESLWRTAPLPQSYVRRVRKKAQKERSRHAGGWKKQVADLKILTDSAGRAGDVTAAMRLYHKMGVILDNAEKYDEAIKMYEQYLSLCQSTNNAQGECLAYNCLGIDCYKIGDYDKALAMHNKHLELADSSGKFVAHSNLGLCYHALKIHEHASTHHQHAIEYATRMGVKEGQQIAVGNLGMVSYAQGDLSTSRICLNYHLAMQRAAEGASSMPSEPSASASLGGKSQFTKLTNAQSELRTHMQLGQVSCAEGRLDEATSHLARSIELARETRSHNHEEKCSVLLGVVQGMQGFDQYRSQLMSKSGVEAPVKAIEE
jgi:tetratricopeptide (TPR) repeat protein